MGDSNFTPFSFLTREVVQLCFLPDGAPLGIKSNHNRLGEISVHANLQCFFSTKCGYQCIV